MMTLTEDRSALASAEANTLSPLTGVPEARRAMVLCQLRTSGVNEPWVLEAMASLPREDFVPEAMRDAAYIDRAIPLGNGRFLAEPLVHARMLAEVSPTATDKILLVGDTDGYFAALLRKVSGSVSVISPADAAIAGEGGFSVIVIDGAIEELPEALSARLVEGGRLVTGLVARGMARLAVGKKAAGSVSLLPLSELGIPALSEFAAPKRWNF